MRARVARSKLEAPRDGMTSRWAGLNQVAGEFKDFKPAPSVLTRVRAVPTIFPQFDLATRVGGLPTERVTLLHGPSGGGKTYFSIGILLSFLMRDHFAKLIDAERTTPISWLEAAMGGYHNHPFFFADRPDTYENTVKDIRTFTKKIRSLRNAKKLGPETTGVMVLDSIRKLVPKDQFDRLMKEAKERAASGEKDGDNKNEVRNRIAQQKALMNAAWMDELVPLLEQTGTTIIIIARETLDTEAPPPRAKGFGPKPPPVMKTGGGSALFYDASLDLRVSRQRKYGKEVDGKWRNYGDVHRLDIIKSKVSGREEYSATCEFHVSNGALVPKGFDRARDLVELARKLDVIEGTGWLKYERTKWRSADVAVKALSENKELFAAIERDARSCFKLEATR